MVDEFKLLPVGGIPRKTLMLQGHEVLPAEQFFQWPMTVRQR